MLSGIYRMLLTHSKLGMSKEILATKVLPFLLPLCIEQNLSMSQYETLTTLVVDMINRVTSEHREALRQLDVVRRETQQFDQALSQTASPAFIQNNGLSDINLTSEMIPSASANLKTVNIENGLSIEDKFRFVSATLQELYVSILLTVSIKYIDNYLFRLIQQQETHQRLLSQSILTPKAVSQPTKSQPKDLTATLLKNNLDELNLSMSRPTMSQPDYTAKNTTLSWNKNNNINQTQSQFLTSPTFNSQTMSNRSLNWNPNGINSPMSWNSEQSTSMWNPVVSQNNTIYSQWEGQAKFSTQPKIKPNLNFSGTSQPFTSPTNTQTANKPDSSTQDIMDLLS